MMSPQELPYFVLALLGELADELVKALCVLLLELCGVFPMLAKCWVFDLSGVAPDDGSEGLDARVVGDLYELHGRGGTSSNLDDQPSLRTLIMLLAFSRTYPTCQGLLSLSRKSMYSPCCGHSL